MTLSGKVLSVETRNLGEPATAAAAVSDTILYVNDAATFDEFGGFLLVNGEQLPYSGIDADVDTITLASPLTVAVADQDLVEIYPATPVKTALVSLGGDGDPIPATVPHSLLDRLPDGVRADAQSETVTLEQRGTYEFLVADIVAEQLETQSLDFIEGEEGWGQDETRVQMQDAQVTGEIGAAVVSAEQMMLGGVDLVDILDQLPRGIVKAVSLGSGGMTGGGNMDATERRIFTFNVGQVYADRLYRISYQGYLVATTADSSWVLRQRATLDGTEATVTSTVISANRKMRGTANDDFSYFCDFIPDTDGELSLALTAQLGTGSGTAYIYLNDTIYKYRWMVEDIGPATKYDPASLSHKLKVNGSGEDNPPITQKVLALKASHSEYFMGFAGRTGAADRADGGYGTIGWQQDLLYSGNDRPDFTILHYNHAAIVSALSAATSIVSVTLKFKVKTRLSASGLDLSVFAHKYASYPHSMAGDYVTETAATRIVAGQGSRNDCAPGSTYTITLNSAVGTNLKSGLYKGIGITSTVFTAAGVGEFYAPPHIDTPTLTITYMSP